eukprot:Sspe_Gene.63177::Locus_35948_Transcript_1_1_Confidence_1.000_Length_2516::g.63177::m.63177
MLQEEQPVRHGISLTETDVLGERQGHRTLDDVREHDGGAGLEDAVARHGVVVEGEHQVHVALPRSKGIVDHGLVHSAGDVLHALLVVPLPQHPAVHGGLRHHRGHAGFLGEERHLADTSERIDRGQQNGVPFRDGLFSPVPLLQHTDRAVRHEVQPRPCLLVLVQDELAACKARRHHPLHHRIKGRGRPVLEEGLPAEMGCCHGGHHCHALALSAPCECPGEEEARVEVPAEGLDSNAGEDSLEVGKTAEIGGRGEGRVEHFRRCPAWVGRGPFSVHHCVQRHDETVGLGLECCSVGIGRHLPLFSDHGRKLPHLAGVLVGVAPPPLVRAAFELRDRLDHAEAGRGSRIIGPSRGKDDLAFPPSCSALSTTSGPACGDFLQHKGVSGAGLLFPRSSPMLIEEDWERPNRVHAAHPTPLPPPPPHTRSPMKYRDC